MVAVRQIIDSNLLNGIIQLPREFNNKKVEVVVSVKEEKTLPSFTKEQLDEMVEKSSIRSLLGIIPDDGMTLDDYRAERLSKYERID
jgi:hypothetical protein